MEGQNNLLRLLETFLFFLIAVDYSLAQQARLSSEVEWTALLELRASLGISAKDWPKKVDPCSEWKGITCREDGRVVEIKLTGLRRTNYALQNPQFSVDSLSNFTFLNSFNSSGFSLPGSIPTWFGQSLNSLKVLDLSSSSVNGSIPNSLGNLTNLNSLILSDNNITGAIPSSLGNLLSLAVLSLSNNQLTAAIPASLGRLLSLSVLDLSENSLTGPIPSAFASLANVTRLDLASNYLSGTIPSELGALSKLRLLNLSDNSLAGSVPSELGNLSQLVELDLGLNSLSGSLPSSMSSLSNLTRLVIGSTGLGGSLPKEFSRLQQLEVLVLSNNKFDGDLPDVFWSMPKLLFLDVSGNNLTGYLPNVSLSRNSGNVVFNLSNNLFYGYLTTPVSGFRLIDLSSNYFQGNLADDYGSNANVSGNCFRNVPNQRSSDDCQVFYHIRDLPFDGSEAPAPSPELDSEGHSSSKLTYILVGIFGGLGFMIILVLVIVLFVKVCDKRNSNQRGAANGGAAPEGSNLAPPKVPVNLSGVGKSYTYEQMLLFTGNFSETNLMKHGHSGDLFRGILASGLPIVIKKIDLQSSRRESYMLELEFFSKASHPRLVPLLGHCFEHETEKFLVYKYMPNGDLSNSLYRLTALEDDGLQSLDWITRLKIAIGTAEGLFYLHHECTPPLVHRDVQASSILLDDKFEVRLGSLSEVCAQVGDSHQSVITKLLRIPQMSEQGPSGPSSTTCAYDVYCFGKVLLELVTGKVGISKSDEATTREWLEHTLSCISLYDKELVTKIVDPSLIVDEDLLEEVWAMAVVARSCLDPKPSRRPAMKYVLKALENPLKVVREENSGSARLRRTSSRRSWNAALFGSWHHSSSESATIPGITNKHAGVVGSHSSGNDLSSSHKRSSNESHKRSSNEIFPEPVDMQDIERQDVP
ncbi:Leucine-rich repeat-containing N-terminal, plant-type [Dillenia turbinata]|uniref:Leucine-rich repeat-containing N-terminal, plant-type n=1 Tax=Dillenia turbinata TaxID=194707 RepID=A0AAN8ZMI1_9MAGN